MREKKNKLINTKQATAEPSHGNDLPEDARTGQGLLSSVDALYTFRVQPKREELISKAVFIPDSTFYFLVAHD